MDSTLSKKEIKRQIKETYARIDDSKDAIKGEFRHFRKAAKNFVKATDEFKSAKEAFDKKPKAKREKKLDIALGKFYQANDNYKEVLKSIDNQFNSVEQDYVEYGDLLAMLGKDRKAEKSSIEFEEYREWLENKLTAMSKNVPELVEDEPVEEPVEEDGCVGAVSLAGIALVAFLGACTVFVSKKKYD